MERDFSERMVSMQMLKVRGESRDSSLERGNNRTHVKNLLLTSVTLQKFIMSEVFCRNFKFGQHQIKIIKMFSLRFR